MLIRPSREARPTVAAQAAAGAERAPGRPRRGERSEIRHAGDIGRRPDQAIRRHRGRARDRLRGDRGRDVRLPRAERRRQDDDHQDPLHAGKRDFGHGHGGRPRHGHRAGRGAPQHRPGLPGHHSGQLPDRGAEPPVSRGALRRAQARDRAEDAPGPGHGGTVGPQGQPGQHFLRRDATPAGDRPRPAARAARAVPRRADRRPRPADPLVDLEVHQRSQEDARTSRSS